jgi:allantoinase
MAEYDLVVRNVDVVRHDRSEPERSDIAISSGRIARVAPRIGRTAARDEVDGEGMLALPGGVDAHQHVGMYNPIEADMDTETRAAAQGGVTAGLTYTRTGQYYLGKSGPYAEFVPELLRRAAGRSYIDYAFHLAPMMRQHIEELPHLIADLGVTSFKIFMFYGSHGLHGRSDSQRSFLMIPEGEQYDIAHFEFVMRGIQAARVLHPELADAVSLSLHCETPEIMTAYTKLVEEQGELKGLAAYSASRPPHSEGLAITIASYLAYETELPNINLLHLSSAKALDAAMMMDQTFPGIDFRREVTIGHLLIDYDSAACGIAGKVNPPLRSHEDVEALWAHVLAGHASWVASDHACCREEQKFGEPRDDVFRGSSGFGGTEYLLPGLITEGRRRGLGFDQIAALVAWNPAQRYGLRAKGLIAEGYDADIALVRLTDPWVVHSADSYSSQGYTPFEGMSLEARVVHTFLRGEAILRDGAVTGPPRGQFLRRPTAAPAEAESGAGAR